MGMDIIGKNGNYYLANIWNWRATRKAMELAGYDVPDGWSCNQGEGLSNQEECDVLANKIEYFLKSWDGEILDFDPNNPIKPGRYSAISVSRQQLEAFVKFVRESGGFQIF